MNLLYIFALIRFIHLYSFGVRTVQAHGATSCATGESKFDFNVKLDQYPQDVHWAVYGYDYTLIDSGGFTQDLASKSVTTTICFPPRTPDCYFFEITDAAWDGICCDWGKGSYSYNYKSADKNTKNASARRNGAFGGSDVTVFGNCGKSPLPLDRLQATSITVTNVENKQLNYESNQNAVLVQFPFQISFSPGNVTGTTDIDYDFGKKYYIEKMIIETQSCSKFDDFRVGVSIDKKDNFQPWVFTDDDWPGVGGKSLEFPIKAVGNKLRIEVLNGMNSCDTQGDLFVTFGFWKVVILGYDQDQFAPTPTPKQIQTKAPKALKRRTK